MTDSKPAPRMPQRPAPGDDRYTWMGVAWLLLLAGGFMGLVMLVLPISFPLLVGIMVFISLNVVWHYFMGRWVAKQIAASPRDDDFDD